MTSKTHFQKLAISDPQNAAQNALKVFSLQLKMVSYKWPLNVLHTSPEKSLDYEARKNDGLTAQSKILLLMES